MVANTIESCYSRIKTLWKDVKPITSNTKHGNNSTKIGSQENPLNSALLGYCFDVILGFKVIYRPFEKINYVIGFDYKGMAASASDRKLEYAIFIEDRFKEEFVEILKNTKPILEEIFQAIGEKSVMENKLTLMNQYPKFKDKLDYYEEKIELLYEAQIEFEKEHRLILSFITNAQKASLLCEEMGWPPNTEWRQLVYEVETYIDVFYSYLEHLLTLLIVFSPEFDLSKEYKKEWTKGWKSKSYIVFGNNAKSCDLIEKLEKYKEIYRNRNAHGLFSKETKAYIEIPKLGRYPLGLGKNYIKGFNENHEEYLSYSVFLDFKKVYLEFEHLVYDEYPIGMIYIQSGLPVPVDIKEKIAHVKTVEEAEIMVDKIFGKYELIQNMDW